MDNATTAGATIALSAPWWLHTLNPYVQFTVGVLGALWLGVQIYYKIRNERTK